MLTASRARAILAHCRISGLLAAPSDAIVLFDGRDNSGWSTMDGKPSKCTVAEGVMICRTGAGDTQSNEKFRDAQIHVEFNLPYEPEMRGQGRANSSVVLLNRYEIQIQDSYENATYANSSCGTIGHEITRARKLPFRSSVSSPTQTSAPSIGASSGEFVGNCRG
jgi:hypothetical protein